VSSTYDREKGRDECGESGEQHGEEWTAGPVEERVTA